jgi:CRISPR-associated protein Csm3
MMKLYGKLIITGKIKALTGLSIGGSKTDVAIGGIDNNVIKTAEGVPYIPGSSLKGKLRSLLEKENGKEEVCACGSADCPICTIFGTAASRETQSGATRLYVRDSMLDAEIKKQMEEKTGPFAELELTYTESKWENKINRLTSKADHPRQQERVPAGSVFTLNMVYNLLALPDDADRFNDVIKTMRLLEDDYLGGNGSRGYGRIKFTDLNITLRTIEHYEKGDPGDLIFSGTLDSLEQAKVIQVVRDRLPQQGER